VGPSQRFGDRLDNPLLKCVPESSLAVMIHDHGGFRSLIQGSGALRKVNFQIKSYI